MTTAQAPARAPAQANGNGHAPPSAARFSGQLELIRERVAKVLPKHLTPDRCLQVASLLFFRTPELQKCQPDTILASVSQAASLGLDLTPATGEAYLVPVWNKNIGGLECQFRPGYRGLAKLAKQSGEARTIQARRVFERDLFSYRFTPDLEFVHQPHLGGNAGPVLYVYASAKLTTGETLIEVMTTEEIEAIHTRSEGYKAWQRKLAKEPNALEQGPWVTDRGEMEKKTVIRRLCKSLTLSPELTQAIEADDRGYDLAVPHEDASVQAPSPGRGVAGLRSSLGIEHAPAMPSPVPDATETRETAPVQPQESTPQTVEDGLRKAINLPPKQEAASKAGPGESWLDWSTQTIKQANEAWAEEQAREGVEPGERKALLNSFELVGVIVNGAMALQADDEARAKVRESVGKDGDPSKRDQKKAGRFAAEFFGRNPILTKQIVVTRIRQKRCELRAQLGMPEDPDDYPGSDSDDGGEGQ